MKRIKILRSCVGAKGVRLVEGEIHEVSPSLAALLIGAYQAEEVSDDAEPDAPDQEPEPETDGEPSGEPAKKRGRPKKKAADPVDDEPAE